MKIILPKPYKGKDIITAAERLFFESGEQKATASVFVDEFQYEFIDGMAKQTPRSKGVKIQNYYSAKTLFKKEIIWKKWGDALKTEIEPLVLEEDYSEIDLDIEYAYDANELGDFVLKDPSNRNFKDISSIIEKIVTEFYLRLQSL